MQLKSEVSQARAAWLAGDFAKHEDTKMSLHAVTIQEVYPVQCVTVTDCPERAEQLANYLRKHVADLVQVEPVECFYPRGMTDADPVWLAAAKRWQQANKH